MSTSDVSYLNNGRGAARIFKNCQALFRKKRRKKRSPTVYCRTSNFSQFVKSLNLLALDSKLTPEMVYAAVSPRISTSGENARTIKYKVQQVIEELLFQEVMEKMSISNQSSN